ncbi:MAG TPA: flagellar motor protein MotD [Nevskiaceae bacterium]|nr:flagellar motor protein MotD [Nevskiaceae bacterium]
MAGKKKHEKEANVEGWAIPYGDLLTLLLAFFVVMYAISSVNAGKYRVLSEALNTAFGGPPRTFQPIQLGTHEFNSVRTQMRVQPFPARNFTPVRDSATDRPDPPAAAPTLPLPMPPNEVAIARSQAALAHLNDKIAKLLEPLVKQGLVHIKRSKLWLEVEIGSDILFESGSATMPPNAQQIINEVAQLLATVPNSLRVEGYTDDTPIHTALYPSNWELSAARAASVVHLMIGEGVSPDRIALAGYGQYRPIASNATAAGRNANRRVVIIVLADNAALRALLKDPGRLPSNLFPVTSGAP